MLLLYLDQNHLSGIAKRKPAFRELEPALRAAVARRAVAVSNVASSLGAPGAEDTNCDADSTIWSIDMPSSRRWIRIVCGPVAEN